MRSLGRGDGADFAAFQVCMSGPDTAPPLSCLAGGLSPSDSGLFALHGRPVDVLPDGKVLMPFRARTDDPAHGRF